MSSLAAVDAALAGSAPLPRDNGSLVFEEPWQGQVFGMGVVVLERTGASWAEFRDHLVAAVAAHPGTADETPATAYFTAWLAALESLLRARGVLPPAGQAPTREPRSGRLGEGGSA